jgi:hypothetical protein
MEIGFFMPSCHHCLRVDPSTDLGLQGLVLQVATTATSAGPHPNLISSFSSLCGCSYLLQKSTCY